MELTVWFGRRGRHAKHLDEYRRRQGESSGALVLARREPAIPERPLQPPPVPATAPLRAPLPVQRPATPTLPADAEARATMLVERARRLTRAGRHDEAAAPARAAVRMLGDLAGSNPAAHAPALIAALRGLAAVLASAGRHRDALDMADTATTWARRLAAADLRTHRPLLASTLRDLAARLGDAGEDHRALAVAHEAVEIHRSLAAQAPERHRIGLACALDELGGRLSALGDAEAAIASYEEAARLLALTARTQNEALDPLAVVFVHHASLLARAGLKDAAVERAQAAVRLRRARAADTSGPPVDELASTLQTLALLLSGVGRHDDAVAALEEAVRLRASRVRAEPELAQRPEVPVTYALYGNALVDAGRPADAVPPLAAAYGVAVALDLPRIADMAADALRRAYQAEPVAVRSRWHAATGEGLPAWISAPAARQKA